METRKSPAYVDCRRLAIEKEQQATDPRFTVITAATTAEGLGASGFEAYARYQVQADVGAGPTGRKRLVRPPHVPRQRRPGRGC